MLCLYNSAFTANITHTIAAVVREKPARAIQVCMIDSQRNIRGNRYTCDCWNRNRFSCERNYFAILSLRRVKIHLARLYVACYRIIVRFRIFPETMAIASDRCSHVCIFRSVSSRITRSRAIRYQS
jgi:hypothetical protein